MPFTPVGGNGPNSETETTYVNPEQMIGHLLLIWPTEYEADSYTIHPRQDGKPSDAVYADVVDLNLPDDYGQPGKVMRRVKWMQWRLIRDTKHAVGATREDAMLAVMSKDGRAYELADMTHNQQALQVANRWLGEHPQFNPGQDQPVPRVQAQQPQQNNGGWNQNQNQWTPNQQVSSPPQRRNAEESAMDRLRRQSANNPYVTGQQLPPPYSGQPEEAPF